MIKQIPSLNGLRAISIVCVIISHIELKNLHFKDAPGGQIGVNIFFIISGFLITLLLLKEQSSTGTVSLRNFYIRRSLRIFPVYYFLLLVYFVLQCFNVLQISTTSWIAALTYTKYFFIGGKFDWETGHTWSLSVEEHFYLIWPLVFVYLKNSRKIFAIVVIAIIPFVRLFTDVSVLHLFTRADALMVGCLFALYYGDIVVFTKARSSAQICIPFITLALCLGIKKLLPIADADLKNHITLAFFGSYGTITNICIACIIVIAINFENNIFFKFLNYKPINWLGKLSYSIYLWQQLFFSKHIGKLASLPINLICICTVAIISYYYLEIPFLKLKDKFSKKKSPVLPVT